ncbi:MAG TPA: hypothetical protein VFM82_00340 [Flavobacteriaceae bacterium]|nr:hypothetical protein [Flavobacteriaceae bacterium]
MIKVLGMTLTVLGMIALIAGIFGIFGSISLIINPWAPAIVGFIFFLSGIGILKRRKDTDE